MKPTYSSMSFLVEHTNHSPETNYTPTAMQVFILWISQFLKEEIA